MLGLRGRSARSVEIRWLPTDVGELLEPERRHGGEHPALVGTGSAMTTSNAEMRSEVTISSRPSPAS
jgi:hypothetical protein